MIAGLKWLASVTDQGKRKCRGGGYLFHMVMERGKVSLMAGGSCYKVHVTAYTNAMQ